MDIDNIKKEFGYEGKPVQWRIGFDALLWHISDYLSPQWVSVKDGLPEKEGLYLIRWPNEGIDDMQLKDALRHCRHFSSLFWLGPIPAPPKD